MRKVRAGPVDDGESDHLNNSSSIVGDEWADVCHQESKLNYHCLWASAAEVIPCICSSKRKTPTTRDVLSSFIEGCEWRAGKTEFGVELKGGEGMSYPREENLSAPFYFGIDIRSQSEMALGRFPKAYCLDPRSLTDPDSISACLATLEPMSEIAHLCIIGNSFKFIFHCSIGVGEEFIRQQHQPDEDEMGMSLENTLAEYHNVLMSVAVFFMKKGFKNVSVLDGGFAAAARYLLNESCPFKMSTALVDVQPQALDRLLGPGTCEKHLGIKRPVRNVDTNPHRSENDPAIGLSAGLVAVGNFVANVTGQPPPEVDTKQVLEDIGKKLTLFGSSTFATLKRVSVAGVASVVSGAPLPNQAATPQAKPPDVDGVDNAAHGGSTWRNVGPDDDRNALTFVIDEEDEDEDDSEKKGSSSLAEVIPDTTKINVTKTEAEKKQALAIHKLAGVKKGDTLSITRETFPGAILFPAMKEKEVYDENGELIMVPGPDGETLRPVTSSVHRYLVITKERFIVLDSQGKGVGAEAVVKSNHHLTELIKITFKKRDPELVTLFIANPGESEGDGLKKHQYRLNKREDFVSTLQVHISFLFFLYLH